MARKAVLWNYRYGNLDDDWSQRYRWLVEGLKAHGFEVDRHEGLQFDMAGVGKLNGAKSCDVAIYNHCDISHLNDRCIKAEHNWILKPTVPDQARTTLDPLGYGAYSSITYERPNYASMAEAKVDAFFEGQVREWVDERSSKWGSIFKGGTEIPFDDYYLIIGQCAGDYVVKFQDFGDYVQKLKAVVRELRRQDPKRAIVIKLHPYMNGQKLREENFDTSFSDRVEADLRKIGDRIEVWQDKSSIHDFLPQARAVILCNSGAGFEVMMHDKPIIAWGLPEYHWVAYDLRHLCDLKRAIRLNWFDPVASRKFLYWYTQQYCFFDDESATRRIGELLAG